MIPYAEYIETLENAHTLLLQVGWTQGVFEDDNGCMCLGGAVNAAQGNAPFTYGKLSGGVLGALDATIGRHYGEDGTDTGLGFLGGIAVWNDKKVRTSNEVLGMVQATIEDLRKKLPKDS